MSKKRKVIHCLQHPLMSLFVCGRKISNSKWGSRFYNYPTKKATCKQCKAGVKDD